MNFDINLNTYNLIHQYAIKNHIKLQNPHRNLHGFIPTFGFAAILPSLGSGNPPPWAVEANGSRGRNHVWTVLRGCASLASGLSLICSIIYICIQMYNPFISSKRGISIYYMPRSRVGYHGPLQAEAACCRLLQRCTESARFAREAVAEGAEGSDFRRSSDDAIGRGGNCCGNGGFHPQFWGDHLKSNSKVITSDNPIQACW